MEIADTESDLQNFEIETRGEMAIVDVEYELQHFNFCADDIIAQNLQLVKFLIEAAYHSFTLQFIKNHKIPNAIGSQLLHKCGPTSIQIFEECMPKIDEISELFRRTFTIPRNILLPHDLPHRKNYNPKQVETLVANVETLRNQFNQQVTFLSALKEEIEMYEKLTSCMETEEHLMDLVEQHRKLEIVPADDCSVLQELSNEMEHKL